MHIRLQIYVLATCLLLSGKSRKATVSETNVMTWEEAMLECYGKNSVLESNINVLRNYMTINNGVQNIWVGSFKAILAWIEIRGCYDIPLNNLDREEKDAINPSVCQIKCIGRRYFAFRQHNKRCVCFDEEEIVSKNSKNASLCQECINQRDCNTYHAYAVVYKVMKRDISETKKELFCLSYQCEFHNQIPNVMESSCGENLKSYCRNGIKAGNKLHLPFFDYLTTCAENQFSYPLLLDNNPIQLCNISQSRATPIWVGVYRQILDVRHLRETALNADDFKILKKYIFRCSYVSIADGYHMTENCTDASFRRHYLCTTENSTNGLEDLTSTPTTSSECCSKENSTNGLEDHTSTSTTSSECCSKGVIAGTVISILVIVVVVVIIVIILDRRFNCRKPQLKTSNIKKHETTQENNTDGQYHEIDITLGPYSLAKPLSDENTHLEKAAEDDNAYSRIVSAVFDASTVDRKTNHCIENPGYNDVQTNNNKTNSIGYNSNSLPNATISGDYCLAKPIPNPGEIDPYTDNADYDHLGNVKNRDDYTLKVYDHVPNIIDSDVTYDHSTITTCKSESDNYDHFDVPK